MEFLDFFDTHIAHQPVFVQRLSPYRLLTQTQLRGHIQHIYQSLYQGNILSPGVITWRYLSREVHGIFLLTVCSLHGLERLMRLRMQVHLKWRRALSLHAPHGRHHYYRHVRYIVRRGAYNRAPFDLKIMSV